MHQLGFLDFATRLQRIDKAGDPLRKLNETDGWEQFRPILEKARAKEKNRQPVPKAMMLYSCSRC